MERFSGPDSSIECGEKDFSPIVSLLLSYGVWAEKLTRRSFYNPGKIIAMPGNLILSVTEDDFPPIMVE